MIKKIYLKKKIKKIKNKNVCAPFYQLVEYKKGWQGV